jgi:hypothetical protein
VQAPAEEGSAAAALQGAVLHLGAAEDLVREASTLTAQLNSTSEAVASMRSEQSNITTAMQSQLNKTDDKLSERALKIAHAMTTLTAGREGYNTTTGAGGSADSLFQVRHPLTPCSSTSIVGGRVEMPVAQSPPVLTRARARAA